MVHGECQPQFRAVRDALEENLRDPLELGEGVAVVIDGETVVDLWGGHRDAERTLEWEANTLACFFSVGKPIAALALGQLIEAGHMHLDDRVSDHWPGFGQAGKEETTIDQAISHLAGIPGAFGAPRGSAYEWSAMIAAIEAQAPLWPPGTTGCYHTFTYGHIVGELARRASGRTIGELIRTNITEPLGLDLGFGLTPAECSRCADVQMTKGDPLMESIKGEETLIGRCWSPLPLGPDEEDFNGIYVAKSAEPLDC